MAVSALSGVFREYTLSFTTAQNPSLNADVSLVCNFEQAGRSVSERLAGADRNRLALQGRCINPSVIPGDLRRGDKAALEYGQYSGTFEFEEAEPGQLETVDGIIGQTFFGVLVVDGS